TPICNRPDDLISIICLSNLADYNDSSNWQHKSLRKKIQVLESIMPNIISRKRKEEAITLPKLHMHEYILNIESDEQKNTYNSFINDEELLRRILRMRQSLNNQSNVLEARIKQITIEIGGIEIQREAAERQLEFMQTELINLRELQSRQLIAAQRVFALERERERIAFKSASYWDIEAVFDPGTFTANLVSVDGARVATGKDFDSTATLTAKENVIHLDESAARTLCDALSSTSFAVSKVDEKAYTNRPKAPFMTSTLQQAASGRLKWGAQRTMRVAQGLYERGYITYMRTDSTTLSDTAINAARTQAAQLYGADHVPDAPRKYDRKVKNAQEAHEAIRPAGDVFR
ncbi:MAG: hypothetical protein EBR84_03830, partial [Actinobacteria bacterium]|nr:hypothetical protein [Actinomycetota bacterium]